MLEGITGHQPKVKKTKKEMLITPYKKPPEHRIFFLPNETFVFCSLIFVYFSGKKRNVYHYKKSDTTRINKTKTTTLLTYC